MAKVGGLQSMGKEAIALEFGGGDRLANIPDIKGDGGGGVAGRAVGRRLG